MGLHPTHTLFMGSLPRAPEIVEEGGGEKQREGRTPAHPRPTPTCALFTSYHVAVSEGISALMCPTCHIHVHDPGLGGGLCGPGLCSALLPMGLGSPGGSAPPSFPRPCLMAVLGDSLATGPQGVTFCGLRWLLNGCLPNFHMILRLTSVGCCPRSPM